MHGSPLQIAQNQANLKKLYGNASVMRVVTRLSHSNALHYDLTMFVGFENLLYPKIASNMTQFQSDFTCLPTCFFQINYISKG